MYNFLLMNIYYYYYYYYISVTIELRTPNFELIETIFLRKDITLNRKCVIVFVYKNQQRTYIGYIFGIMCYL